MMLLLALFAPWAANAQSVPYEVQIGEGTSTSGYFPFYTLYNYSIAENLFLASELEEAGVLPGEVTSLSWYATNETGNEQQGISIWMANVSDEALTTTSHVTTGMTLVYTGSVTPAVGWNEFMCEENTFTWDGTSNILIFCQRNNGDWNSTINWQATTGVGFNAMSYRYQDSGAYDVTVPNTMYTSTNRPNIIIKGVGESSGPVCTKPSTLDVTDIAGYSATCTWENTGAASYTFEWKKASDSDYTVVSGLTANTYALSSLESFTAYNVRVKAVCGTDLESGYKTANFTTLDVCPDGKVCIGEGTATNSYLPTYNYYNYSLTQQIYSADEIGEAALIESVDIYSVGSVTRNLEIYMVSTEKITFDSVTDWIPATESNRVFSGSVAFAANSWNTMEFDNPFIYDGRHNVVLIVRDITGSYVSSINFFVFNAQGNQAIRAYRDTPGAYDITAPGVSGALLGVKNRVRFGVSELPSCFQPTGLTVSNIEARQAVLSWTENGTATTWDVEVTGDYATTWTATTNPYTLVGLEPDTDYTVKVRANCGGGDYSEWSGAVTFTTDVTCHAPTTLSVSDIEAFSANVNWTGTETTHQLRYVANPPMFFQGFVTDPGAMSDGSDASWIKGASTTWGPSGNYAGGYYLADDFTVNTATSLTEIEVYGYQTGSTTESTFTGLYAMILSGNPMEGTVDTIWGDMTTNLMTSTSFTNCYRGSDGQTTATTRPIMAVTASGLNINLAAGTYWLVYGMTGTLSSGPWGVPYSDPVVGNTGDGLQYTSNGWTTLTDDGSGPYGPAMKLNLGDIESFDWTTVNNISTGEYAMTNLDPETLYLVQVRANCGSEGNSNWVSTTFTTLPSCLFPTDLVVSDIEARQAVLAWTENGDATAWEVEVVGSYTTTWNATENPYTLVGLEPETRYTVRVRSKCSNTDFSEWSLGTSFTTAVACPAPTNLTISDITTTSATIGWTSYNETFDVWYREHVSGAGSPASNDFEGSTFGNWTTIDADGDGYDWVLGSACGGIYLVEGGSLAGTGHNASADLVVSGSYTNVSGALYPDNYLVSPQITLGGSITFWACAQDASYPAEHFGVAVSTTGNTDAADFTTIQEWTMTAKGRSVENVADRAKSQMRGGNRDQGTWYEYTVDLSAYSGQGYVAIRHFDCSDLFLLDVDDIVIVEPGSGTVIPDWIEANGVANPYTITGLTPETLYDVQVRSNCGGDDGVSTWLIGTFTTLSDCVAPWDLEVANITATTADLSWNGYKDSYDVRYYQLNTIFSADFENQLIPTEMVNDTAYPWTIIETEGGYYIQSSNAGVSSSTSSISITVTFTADGTVEFDAECMGEGSSSYWDHCDFYIDDERVLYHGADLANSGWLHYSFDVTAGEHTFTWSYSKDSSVNPTGDYFAIDNIFMGNSTLVSTIEDVTSPYTITGLTPETDYSAQVKGHGCDDWSNMVTFTTLEQTTVTQTLALASGTNWVSFYVDVTLNDLKTALVAALPSGNSTTITIKSQTQNVKYVRGRWSGQLTALDMAQMYLITVSEDCEIAFEGMPIDPSELVATINPGTNWIAFPYYEAMTVTDFFAGFPINNDVVKSQLQNSKYLRGRWSGQLTTLEPGKGYIYNSVDTNPRTFAFPTLSK